jgi:uncharacterized membrane protein
MAGIAFEVRKKLGNKRLSSILQTFAYSAFLSSGSWIISILSIMLTSYIAAGVIKDGKIVVDFQTSVVYLIALSLILSGSFHRAWRCIITGFHLRVEPQQRFSLLRTF